MLSPAAQVVPDLLKPLGILLDTTVINCAVASNRTERYERYEPVLEIQRKAKFFQMMKNFIIYKIFKKFINNAERRLIK